MNGKSHESNYSRFQSDRLNIGETSVLAKEYSEFYDVGGVLFLEFVFMFTPELDQLRIVNMVTAYDKRRARSAPKKTLSFNVEYFSESHGQILRPWHEGEKEDIISAIEKPMHVRSSNGRTMKRYKRERKQALAKIIDRAVVPYETAISEGWSDAHVEQQLLEGIDKIEALLQTPLNSLSKKRYKKRKRNRTEFNYVNWDGHTVEKLGEVIETFDGHTTYRDSRGNLYSIPDN